MAVAGGQEAPPPQTFYFAGGFINHPTRDGWSVGGVGGGGDHFRINNSWGKREVDATANTSCSQSYDGIPFTTISTFHSICFSYVTFQWCHHHNFAFELTNKLMQNYSPHKTIFQYPLFGFKVLILMKTKFGIRPEKRTGSECSVFCSATFFAISRLLRRNWAQRRKEGKARRGRDGLNISKAATREGGRRERAWERAREAFFYLPIPRGKRDWRVHGAISQAPSFTSWHDMLHRPVQKLSPSLEFLPWQSDQPTC